SSVATGTSSSGCRHEMWPCDEIARWYAGRAAVSTPGTRKRWSFRPLGDRFTAEHGGRAAENIQPGPAGSGSRTCSAGGAGSQVLSIRRRVGDYAATTPKRLPSTPILGVFTQRISHLAKWSEWCKVLKILDDSDVSGGVC